MPTNYAKMSRQIISASIPSTARVVYAALLTFHRPNRDTFPSYQKIAEVAGISRRTAIRAVQCLVDAGFITKETRKNTRDCGRNYGHGGFTSNKFIFCGDNNVTSSGDNNVTSSGDNNVTSSIRRRNSINKLNLLNNSRACTREETATAAVQHAAEQTCYDGLPDFQDMNMKKALYLLGNKGMWVHLVKCNKQYYLRPIQKNKVTPETVKENCQILSKEFGIKVDSLKFGQFLYGEQVL